MGKGCVLVTGGAGYIGSHTTVELLESGYDVVVLDNLINSDAMSITRIESMFNCTIPFYSGNLLDERFIDDIFEKHSIDYVIHFAALKSVSESVRQPLRYYENNTVGLINLLKVMNAHSVKKLVFSSSCTVYGIPQFLPLTEQHPLGKCTSPYGASKFFAETILKDLHVSDPKWNIVSLRYFNPVGAHPSARIGEDPCGVPSNLMPYVSKVAAGRLTHVNVYGTDYDTPDGSGIRDYVHIVDLAQAHVISLKMLDSECGLKVYNIGTGRGYSVFEIIHAMEKASGRIIPYQPCPRRPGDTSEIYADTSLATKELGWTAKYDLDKMCEDQWRWQCQNPCGYKGVFQAGDQ